MWFITHTSHYFNTQNRVVRDTLGETWSPESLARNQTQELDRPDSAATTTDSCRDSVHLKKLDAVVYHNDLLNDDDCSGPFLTACLWSRCHFLVLLLHQLKWGQNVLLTLTRSNLDSVSIMTQRHTYWQDMTKPSNWLLNVWRCNLHV